MHNTTRNPLSRLDPDHLAATWSRHDLDRITDDDLLAEPRANSSRFPTPNRRTRSHSTHRSN